MTKSIESPRFLTSIFLSVTLACVLFITLLLKSFTDIDKVASEHIRHQKCVGLVKDIKFHVIQIQQFLTNASLSHRQFNFQEAKNHYLTALDKVDKLALLRPDPAWTTTLKAKIGLNYETGVRMASNYIYKNPQSGELTLVQLDNSSANLTEELNDLAKRVDQELDESQSENRHTFLRDQMILIISVPIILGVFGGIEIKTSLLLKRRMNDLSIQTSQLNAVFETVPSAIITIDIDGTILNFNAAAERIFGYKADEVLGIRVSRLMPEKVAAEHDHIIRQFLKTGDTTILGIRREVQALRQNGETFPAQLRINVMNIAGDMLFCSVIDDISETKTLQSQLNQAQKLEAIGQLASGVAHEINTPIQYIGDNLSALQEYFADIIGYQQKMQDLLTEPLKTQLHELAVLHDLNYIFQDGPKAIQQARDGVARVAEIVKAMKTFSHVELTPNKQILNLHEALNNALLICRNSYKQLAEIEIDFANEVIFIECYPNELNQVFLNLIINATHAIEEKRNENLGLIKMSTRKIGNEVEIVIQDNGTGIPEEIKEKVFNLFFTTKPVGKGTGQGLSLSHHIVVEKHQGKLFFESIPEVGTTFHIQLPIKLENHPELSYE
jgi:two-component system, NtrC family, sensor kinase